VKTDQSLIHTHEIVPVFQFQRESVRQNKEEKKNGTKESAVVMWERVEI
jgi:hypothetical protein